MTYCLLYYTHANRLKLSKRQFLLCQSIFIGLCVRVIDDNNITFHLIVPQRKCIRRSNRRQYYNSI